jgi:APA family basic amino acid/polyamine antiporter
VYDAAMTSQGPRLGLASGIGLVAANMIGAGVFLSAGFMARDLGPGPILLAWVVGALMALCGAVAYGAASRLVPRSGGEYRFLGELLHPALGAMAGWASLLVGFSAPIAVDALAAGAFAAALLPGLPPRAVAVALVVSLTALHASGWKTGLRFQNLLVLVKVAALVAFVVAGLALGSLRWPEDWTATTATGGAFPTGAFATALFYVAFAYSGWNAAVYASAEFEHPSRTVPRAMLVGTTLVAVLYLAVNAVFVANLTPADASVVFGYDGFARGGGGSDAVTLGHAVMARLLGPTAAALWSGVLVLVFASAMSAMIFLGPRVYAEMARDGVLPSVFAGDGAEPPRSSVLLQGALAVGIVLTQSLQTALAVVGGVLTLFAALTAGGVVLAKLRGRLPAATAAETAAAAAYVAIAGWLFARALADPFAAGTTGERLLGIALLAGLAAAGWALSRGPRRA